MTDTHSQQPQTALDLWHVQTRALADPAQADASIQTIYEHLMGLHAKLIENGMTKQAAKVEGAYTLALEIYNMSVQQRAIIDGGAAALTATTEQRQQAVVELAQLMKAITETDESHPKLVSFASSIREDESMDSYEIAYQEIDENITEQIVDAWGVDWEKADMILMAVLGRPEPELTPHQHSLFQAFIDSLTVEGDDEWNSDADEEGAE